MTGPGQVPRRTVLRAGVAGSALGTALGAGGVVAGLSALAGCSKTAPVVAPADLDVLAVAQQMIRFDTSHNGEGGITLPYARMLQAKFGPAGAEVDIIPTPKPDNVHLIARFRGAPGGAGARPNHKPVLFLGHSDVVSVERDRWSTDPFGAEVKDGARSGAARHLLRRRGHPGPVRGGHQRCTVARPGHPRLRDLPLPGRQRHDHPDARHRRAGSGGRAALGVRPDVPGVRGVPG